MAAPSLAIIETSHDPTWEKRITTRRHDVLVAVDMVEKVFQQPPEPHISLTIEPSRHWQRQACVGMSRHQALSLMSILEQAVHTYDRMHGE